MFSLFGFSWESIKTFTFVLKRNLRVGCCIFEGNIVHSTFERNIRIAKLFVKWYVLFTF